MQRAGQRRQARVRAEQVAQQLRSGVRRQRGQWHLPIPGLLHPLGAVLGPEVQQQQASAPGPRVHQVRNELATWRVEPVQVLDHRHRGLLGALNHPPQHADEQALTRLRADDRRGPCRIANTQELEERRQRFTQRRIEQDDAAGDLFTRHAIVVRHGDVEVGAEYLENRQEGNVPAMRDRAPDEHARSARTTSLEELEAQAALAGARFGHHTNHLSRTRACRLEGVLEGADIGRAPDESRQAAPPGYVEARTCAANADKAVHVHRLCDTLDAEFAEVVQGDIAASQCRGGPTHETGVGFGETLHALREPHGVALRRVVHAQVVADAAHHDFARIDADACREADAVLTPHLYGIARQRVAQGERGVACALCMVLMRDRRPEQRHDAVAGVLVHRAFEAMHALGEDREEALEDAVPFLGVELFGEHHRALHIGEQHRHLLALALERRARLQDAVGEVLWCVRRRRTL